MERLQQALNLDSGERFCILYGPGVQDHFISTDYVEMDLDTALHRLLRARGFERIVYHRPDRDIFFLDQQSRELVRVLPASRVRSRGNLRRFTGPLGNLMLLEPRSMAPQDAAAVGGTQSARLLDRLLKEPAPRTAIVFRQIEQVFERMLRNPDMADTLKTVISTWLDGLPIDNRNLCIMVFSVSTADELKETLQRLGLPALAQWMEFRRQPVRRSGCGIAWVGPPAETEVDRVVDYVRLRFQRQVDWLQRRRIVREIAQSQAHTDLPSKLMQLERLDLAKVRAALGMKNHADEDERSPFEKLDALTGLLPVKRKVRTLVNYVEVQRRWRDAGMPADIDPPSMNFVFSGNPGTGKTTVARLIGEMLRELGLLKRGHTFETSVSDLVAEHVGGTSLKTNAVIDRALDGVLFVDEAHNLLADEFHRQALEAILLRAENDRERLCIVLAGYGSNMAKVLSFNAGMKRRFPMVNRIDFPDYSIEELFEILRTALNRSGFVWTPGIEAELRGIVRGMHEQREPGFGNASEMRSLAEALQLQQSDRVASAGPMDSRELTSEDIPPEYAKFKMPSEAAPVDPLDELKSKIGLRPVKQFVQNLYHNLELEQVRRNRGMPVERKSRHLVFTGNPGTGKTMVARLIGTIYRQFGILRRGHTVETKPSDMIAAYVGQTAIKANDIIDRALDGVLFVDEAYQFTETDRGGFGREALDAILVRMENERDRLVVILAGYGDRMRQTIASNPGLESRFKQPLEFPDYGDEELLEILRAMAREQMYRLTPEAEHRAAEYLGSLKTRSPNTFGNARAVRNLFEQMTDRLAERWAHSRGRGEIDFTELHAEDVPGLGTEVVASTIPPPRRYDLVSALPEASGGPSGLASAARAAVFLTAKFRDGREGSGSGFIVTPRGHVVTSFHVVQNAESILVRLEGRPGRALDASIVGWDAEADLAILTLPEDEYEWMGLTAESEHPRLGDPIAVLGYPLGEDLGQAVSFTDGAVSSLRERGDVLIVQISAAATHGSSGGAVVNRSNWRVIGILQGGISVDIAAGFNFAVSVAEIYKRFGSSADTAKT